MPDLSHGSIESTSPSDTFTTEMVGPITGDSVETMKKQVMDHYLDHINSLETGSYKLAHLLSPEGIADTIIKMHKKLAVLVDTDPTDIDALNELEKEYIKARNELDDKARARETA
jgi:hypothetical protein